MRIKKRLGGLILLSMGVGMLIAFMMPGLSLLLAGMLIIIGFIYFFI